MNKKRIVIISSLTVFMAIIVFYSFITIGRVGKMEVNIVVAPNDSEIKIDNIKVNVGKNYLSAGEHKIIVERKHFLKVESSFSISESDTYVPPIALKPVDSEGLAIEKLNQKYYIEADNLFSEKYIKETNKLEKKYPILKKLPRDYSPNLRIDYGVSKKYPNDESKIALYISTKSGSNSAIYRQTALDIIYRMGYDPSDYEIIFQTLNESKT